MPSIVYEFSAAGHGGVVQAFKSTAQAEEEAAQRSARAARKVTDSVAAQVKAVQQANQRGAQSAARNQVREYEAQQKAQERARTQETRAAERVAAQEAKAKERARVQEARAQEKATQAAERARVKSAERAAAQEAKAQERTAREQTKLVARQQAQQALMWRKYEEERAAVKRGATAMGVPGSGGGGGLSAWEIAKGTMVGGFAVRGAFAAVDMVKNAARSVADLQEAANRTSINARQAGQEFVDPQALIQDVQKAALGAPGQKAADIMQALQSFVSLTGELGTGRQSAGAFATVASATGSNVGDVAQAAASIFNQFGLKTKEEMQDVLASLTFQGKTGAFELRDAASQFQRLAAAGASFGLSGAKGVKTIGGLAQIARTGTGSAAQTTTAIENIFSNLIAKSAILKREGVNVYDKTGKTRDVTDVLLEAIVKSGKSNFEKKGQILQQVFGDQGIRGVRPLLAKYQSTFQEVRNKGGSEAEAAAAGLKRLREEIDKSVNAPGAWDEVQKDAAQAANDVNAQTTRAFEAVQASLTKTVTPAVAAFAVALTGVVSYLQEKGLLKGPDDDVTAKRNRLTLEQAKAREQEMLANGPIAPEDMAEFQDVQDQIAKGELRGASEADIQGQINAIYGKGGVMSPEDEATADRLQGELNRRKGEGGFVAPGLLSQQDFINKYIEAGGEGDSATLARMRAGVFANAMQGNGERMPEWMYTAMGETEEQSYWRSEYKARMGEGKKGERAYAGMIEAGMGMPGVPWHETEAGRVEYQRAAQGGEELRDAAAQLKAAAAAMQNASQPSITGVSGPSTAPGS
jgi:chemotaxis protein histidine kinase CheA